MGSITIWHNPRCSKSREALALLEEADADINVVHYLKDPPSRREINRVLKLLGAKPREMMRKREKLYSELKLADKGMTKRELVGAMAENPKLIERPVVINESKAVIARPPELAREVLD